ncbi:putative nuclease HARBI1 [Odontomachus brunneus]|uniref:putative nuclease HARBI1 n=1 Tax=Odontomachus brunneus TaxID=486640 RepID=UPI0013F2556F|nr:putative nuclease HARBI1 [Odontomachus brunneus]
MTRFRHVFTATASPRELQQQKQEVTIKCMTSYEHKSALKAYSRLYRNRLAVLPVLPVCDYHCKILAVVASHGGRTHDARVWSSSRLCTHMFNEYEHGRRNVWLIGDSGYPLLAYLMTPKLNQPLGSPSALYTDNHIKARCSVERTIGILKGRWRCLRKERALHYSPEFAALIINATCVLHNIAKQFNVPNNEIYREENVDEEGIEVEIHLPVNMRAKGQAIREAIIQRFFNQ